MRRWFALLLLAALMLPVVGATAQDAGLAGLQTQVGDGAAATALNGALGAPVVFNAHIFTTVYDGLMNPINAATSGIAGGMTAWIAGWFVAAAGCVLLVLAIGSMLGRFQDDVVIRWGLRSGAVMMIAASSSGYSQWVSRPLLNLPTEIGNVVTGAVGGGAFTSGGSVFDQINNGLWNGADAAVRGVPLFPISTLVAIVLLALGAACLGSLILAGAFCFYLVTAALLQLLVGIGPLFVVFLVFVPTRHMFQGWLSSVAAQIVGLTLITVLLAIMSKLVLTELATLSAAGSNVNPISAAASLVSVAGELLILLILCFSVRSLSSGLVGGVMAELGILTGALRVATGAAGAALSGGGSRAGSGASAGGAAGSAGASTFAGRNLSRGGSP